MVVLISTVLLVWLFHEPLLYRYAGLFLRDDGVVKSDAVVVAGGGFKTRLGKAVEYYRDGYADRIAIFVLPVSENLLIRHFYPGETAITQKILEEGYDVSDYDMLSNGGKITSTYEEALAIRDYCLGDEINVLTVVTDDFHSFRAGYVYEKWAGDICEINIFPVYPENQVSVQWWRNERGIKNIFLSL